MKIIIDVKVNDLKRAVDFYTEKLGLNCRRQEKDWAAIEVGDAEIHLYLHGGISSGLEFYVDDLDKEVKRLKGSGVEFFSGEGMPNFISVDENQITKFPWGRNAFFKDSEGNQLALVEDYE
jgi:predicted enzyme related to lactoylglutathione lyase